MKIKIDKNGSLWIERSGKWKEQTCPYVFRICCDSCPLFGEPERKIKFEANTGKEVDMIELCRTTIFGEVIDERIKED